MMQAHPAHTWGRTEHGGEASRHAFCFSDYFAPDKLGFGALRVMNETRVAASDTWQQLRRANMEIITWVLAGSLLQRHADGSQTRIEAGQVQCLSAGRGMQYQQRAQADAHYLQFWIQPNQVNAQPRISMAQVADTGWASMPTLQLRQDAYLRVARLTCGQSLKVTLQDTHRYWLQIVQGEVEACGKHLKPGDALAWQGKGAELEVSRLGSETAQLLLLSLPE